MSPANLTQINLLNKQIADLRQAEAREIKKAADAQGKINRAQEAIARTKNLSTRQSKLREVERAAKDLAAAQKKSADLAGKIATKSKDLSRYQESLAREEERTRKKAADHQKRLHREREQHERAVTNELRRRAALIPVSSPPLPEIDRYDFFICHASEDKDGFVRALAEELTARGAKVWYDESTLNVGDSLRREIDRGLSSADFGIVVLSKNFFQKEWAQRELDGLVSLEADGNTRILPIWHEISKDEVLRRSPTLADKVALNTSLQSTAQIADKLCGLLDSPYA